MNRWGKAFDDRIDRIGVRLKDKEIRIPINLTASVLCFLFALVILLIMPQQVQISEKDVVNGRAFPTLLMTVMMLCSGMLAVKEVYKIIKKQPLEWKSIHVLTEVKALIIFGILFFTYFLSKVTGLFLVGAVFCSLGFLLYFRCRKRSYYAITLFLSVVIWAVFRFVLKVGF